MPDEHSCLRSLEPDDPEKPVEVKVTGKDGMQGFRHSQRDQACADAVGGFGGEQRRVTLLMSDLRGFTPLTEGLAPEQKPLVLGPAQEEIEVAYAGDALDIGFNVNYLLDVLNNVGGAQVECHFGDAASSALLQFPAEPEFKYVVMPMRI